METRVRDILKKHGIEGYSIEEIEATDKTLSILLRGIAILPVYLELAAVYDVPLHEVIVEGESIESGYCETCYFCEPGVRITIGAK